MKPPGFHPRRVTGAAVAGLLLFLAASVAQGPGLHLAWGTSNGIGAMSGGNFSLHDGGEFTMVTSRESMDIARDGGHCVVSWSRLADGWRLEWASSLTGSWSSVSPALCQTNTTRKTYTVPIDGPSGFYRLAIP